jgi:hypothetical protein
VNLLGYPHGEEAWDLLISASREELAEVFAKCREVNRDFLFAGIRKSIEALAADGEPALALMPRGSVRADERPLAQCDEWRTAIAPVDRRSSADASLNR